MTDVNAYAALAERLCAATGPDRALDEAITLLFYPDLAEMPRSEFGGWMHPEWGLIAPPTRYTSDLDEVIGLCEAKAPTLFPGVQKHPMGWGAELVYPEPRRDRMGTHFAICSDSNWLPNPALALLAALMRALADNLPASAGADVKDDGVKT